MRQRTQPTPRHAISIHPSTYRACAAGVYTRSRRCVAERGALPPDPRPAGGPGRGLAPLRHGATRKSTLARSHAPAHPARTPACYTPLAPAGCAGDVYTRTPELDTCGTGTGTAHRAARSSTRGRTELGTGYAGALAPRSPPRRRQPATQQVAIYIHSQPQTQSHQPPATSHQPSRATSQPASHQPAARHTREKVGDERPSGGPGPPTPAPPGALAGALPPSGLNHQLPSREFWPNSILVAPAPTTTPAKAYWQADDERRSLRPAQLAAVGLGKERANNSRKFRSRSSAPAKPYATDRCEKTSVSKVGEEGVRIY